MSCNELLGNAGAEALAQAAAKPDCRLQRLCLARPRLSHRFTLPRFTFRTESPSPDSPSAPIHRPHRFTLRTDSPSAPIHLPRRFTLRTDSPSHRFTLRTDSPSAPTHRSPRVLPSSPRAPPKSGALPAGILGCARLAQGGGKPPPRPSGCCLYAQRSFRSPHTRGPTHECAKHGTDMSAS